MQTISAIPTDYRGVHFRSRLEAKWACFFDNVGWPWEYEPFDLQGYIPDFILPLKPGHVLFEVKPVLEEYEFEPHWNKITKSGWKGEAIIGGAKMFEASHGAALGKLLDAGKFGHGDVAWAILQTCQRCHCISFYHEEQSWCCRVCGVYKGNEDCCSWSYEEARKLFYECGRIVQYNAD